MAQDETLSARKKRLKGELEGLDFAIKALEEKRAEVWKAYTRACNRERAYEQVYEKRRVLLPNFPAR